MILFEYPNVFPDMIKTKKEILKLIDDDILSIVFAMNITDTLNEIYNNKIIITPFSLKNGTL